MLRSQAKRSAGKAQSLKVASRRYVLAVKYKENARKAALAVMSVV
jgi:hypothetical protein